MARRLSRAGARSSPGDPGRLLADLRAVSAAAWSFSRSCAGSAWSRPGGRPPPTSRRRSYTPS